MSLLEAINIGASGLLAQSQRLEIHAKNIANIDTPNYVRKIPVLVSNDDISFQGMFARMKDGAFTTGTMANTSGRVSMTGVVEDTTPGDLVYNPGHPDADKNGYVRKSNVNPLADMADATMASRAYEASLAIVSITKQMAQRATTIGTNG